MPQLDSFCDLRSGLPVRSSAAGAGPGVVRLSDLWADATPIDWAGLARADDGSTPARHLLRAGEVLFAAKGQSNQAVAVDQDHDAVASAALFVIRPNSDVALGSFVAWYLNTSPAQAHILRCARGTNMRSVSKSCLGSVEVPLPSLDAQRQLVDTIRLAREERTLSDLLSALKTRFVEAACLGAL